MFFLHLCRQERMDEDQVSAWDFQLDTVRGPLDGPKKTRESVVPNTTSVVENHSLEEATAGPLPEGMRSPADDSPPPPTRLSNGLPGAHEDDLSAVDEREPESQANGPLSYPPEAQERLEEGGEEEGGRKGVEVEVEEGGTGEGGEEAGGGGREGGEGREEEEGEAAMEGSGSDLSMNSLPAHNELELYETVVTDEEVSVAGDDSPVLPKELAPPSPLPASSTSLSSVIHPVLERVCVLCTCVYVSTVYMYVCVCCVYDCVCTCMCIVCVCVQ